MLYGQVALIITMLIITVWRRDIFFYLLSCPLLIVFGLHWYDRYHNAAGFTMSMALIAIGIYCMILAIANLLKRE